MRAYDIIVKKRDRLELSDEEIRFFIREFVKGRIPDYQVSAWLMACFLNGLSAKETASLTSAMVESGDKVDLSCISGIKVDKHSTGGVGDKTTLVLVPILAAAGLKIAKMSGRGLGHTGGTIDKLESIPGMRVDLTTNELCTQVSEIGAAMIGQTGELAPADKKLYALRDVTGTVESIPLIASSIMSKKIAAGADIILLDVKVGSGAFMKTKDDARRLSQAMVEIGKSAGKQVTCVITDMDQPLGNAVGNALEVAEAVEAVKGRGPQDLGNVCIKLAGILIQSAGLAHTFIQGEDIARSLIDSGAAAEKLRQIIEHQGGDGRIVDDVSLLPKAERIAEFRSLTSGFVSHMDAELIGRAAMLVGAGRLTKEDKIDHSAGIVLRKKVGDRVDQGDVLADIHCSLAADPSESIKMLEDACVISSSAPEPPLEIFEIIRSED